MKLFLAIIGLLFLICFAFWSMYISGNIFLGVIGAIFYGIFLMCLGPKAND